MSHAAIITNGIVTNVIMADEIFAASIDAIICDKNVSIGWSYDESKNVFKAPPSPAIDLDALKLDLKQAIDTAAEHERYKYITPGSGQAMTYQAKAAEAQRYADTSGVGDYPLLMLEVGITGDTLADVAAVVLDMHNQWLAIGGAIEQVRLSAKAQVDAAQDEVSVRAVVPLWPEL